MHTRTTDSDTPTVHRIERRLAQLEREVWAFRVASLVGLGLAFVASCGAPPAAPVTAFDLASDDGARRVHLDLDGLRIESDGRSATYRVEGLDLHDGSVRVSIAADVSDAVTVSGPGGSATLTPGSVWVARGTGRAALDVDEHAAAFLTLRSIGGASLNAFASSSSVLLESRSPDGVAHTY